MAEDGTVEICPACGVRVRIGPGAAGRAVRCPKCGRQWAASAPAEPEPLPTAPTAVAPSHAAALGANDRTGTVLGDFRISRVLGRGGMGTVYEALDTGLDSDGRPQGAAARGDGRGKREYRVPPPRGPAGGQARTPQHRGDLSGGPAGRHLLHRHAVGARGVGLRPAAAERPVSDRRGGADCAGGAARAGGGPCDGNGPPRHQAGEHPDLGRRGGQGRRLRAGQVAGRQRGGEHHGGRGSGGDAPIHEPRAGTGRARGCPNRHLLVGRDPLLPVGRAASVRRGRCGDDPPRPGVRPGAGCPFAAARRAGRLRADHRAGDGQKARGPVSVG